MVIIRMYDVRIIFACTTPHVYQLLTFFVSYILSNTYQVLSRIKLGFLQKAIKFLLAIHRVLMVMILP